MRANRTTVVSDGQILSGGSGGSVTALRGQAALRGLGWATLCLALASFGVAGCKRKPPREEEPAKASVPAEEKVAVAPTDPIEAALYNVAEHCSFNEEHAVISK